MFLYPSLIKETRFKKKKTISVYGTNGSTFKVYTCVSESECNHVMIVHVGGKVATIEKKITTRVITSFFFFLAKKFPDGLKIILQCSPFLCPHEPTNFVFFLSHNLFVGFSLKIILLKFSVELFVA